MKTTNPSRVSRASLALSASFLLAATVAQGNTTFSAFFNNGTVGSSGDKTAAVYNWSVSVGSAGTIVNSPATVAGVSQGVTNTTGVPVVTGSTAAGFLFYVPASGAPGAMMLYRTSLATSNVTQDAPQGNWFRNGTDNLTGLTLGAISQLSVYTRPANTATEMRFAIQVGGAWYASATAFNQTNLAAYEQKVITPSAVNWISGVGTPGTDLDLDLSDNPSAALPPGSVITGYGWYAKTGALTGTDSRVRIDSYEIKLPVTSDAYTLWAGGSFANPFTNTAPEVDFDNDGLTNSLEFVLGGDPTISQPGISPSVVSGSGGDLVITFKRSDVSQLQPVIVKVQVSDDLAIWNPADDITIVGDANDPGPIGGTGASYTVDDSGALDTIVVTIPKGAATKKFARVVATQ